MFAVFFTLGLKKLAEEKKESPAEATSQHTKLLLVPAELSGEEKKCQR